MPTARQSIHQIYNCFSTLVQKLLHVIEALSMWSLETVLVCPLLSRTCISESYIFSDSSQVATFTRPRPCLGLISPSTLPRRRDSVVLPSLRRPVSLTGRLLCCFINQTVQGWSSHVWMSSTTGVVRQKQRTWPAASDPGLRWHGIEKSWASDVSIVFFFFSGCEGFPHCTIHVEFSLHNLPFIPCYYEIIPVRTRPSTILYLAPALRRVR